MIHMTRQGWSAAALAVAAAVGLAACGGGEGSPGETSEQYHIALQAQKTSLPLNIGNMGPGIGAYAPYTTSLTVSAVRGRGDTPVPEGTELSCNLVSGPDTGALYYLDGEHDGESGGGGVQDTTVQGYRSIVLESNAGAATFHFHAGTQAGTADITCAVTDPRDSQSYTASTRITVGGTSGLPASVIGAAQAPAFLGTRDNTNNIRNNVGIDVFVMDDASQPIGDPDVANVQVEIIEAGQGSSGARLLAGAHSAGPGDAPIALSTRGGVAHLSLSSGPNIGSIVLAMTVDRADNNVANGLQDKITQLMSVPVVAGIETEPLTIGALNVSAKKGEAVVLVLESSGGLPPYTWTVDTGGLPAGLQWNGKALITGVADDIVGDHAIEVMVVDQNNSERSAVAILTIEENK